MHKTYIKIVAVRDRAVVTMDFPEADTNLNRIRWAIAGIIAPIKVRWLE